MKSLKQLPMYLSRFAIIMIVLLSILLATPQPQLDLENELFPLARTMWNSTDEEKPLNGFVAAVTGATSGIGLEISRILAESFGATVIGIGRCPVKLALLESEGIIVKSFVADFTDLNQVSTAANQIIDLVDHIDVLVNNAGIFPPGSWEYLTSKQGYDLTFGVNYLAHFLLTEKLKPLLYNSEHSKVVQVSSSFSTLVPGSDLVSKGEGDPIASQAGGNTGFFVARAVRAYANSKLAQILHARSLQRQDISAKSACTAWVATPIVAKSGGNKFLDFFYQRLAFPNRNGFGINSVLRAILSSPHDNDDDYFVNRDMSFGNWFGEILPDFAYTYTPIRDGIICLGSMVVLFTQRWTFSRGTATSATSSYSRELQDDLYEWSYKAVSKWL